MSDVVDPSNFDLSPEPVDVRMKQGGEWVLVGKGTPVKTDDGLSMVVEVDATTPEGYKFAQLVNQGVYNHYSVVTEDGQEMTIEKQGE